MQRCRMAISKGVQTRTLQDPTRLIKSSSKPYYDVFINHRGIDTKRAISGLLYHHLSSLGLNPFLDSKTMRPGDRLFDKIDPAIRGSRVGLAVFSQRYCESYFCLHELALMMECKKPVVPVFCDVKPSELGIKYDGNMSKKEFDRFHRALEEAKYTVGLTFDTLTGDWSEFLKSATDIVIQRLLEVEEKKKFMVNRSIVTRGDMNFANIPH